MNRRGFFRFLASAPAAAVVAPAAITEVIDFSLLRPQGAAFVSRQIGKSAALAYGYGMNVYGGAYTGRWAAPPWAPEPLKQAASRLFRKEMETIKAIEVDMAEVEKRVVLYLSEHTPFQLSSHPGRKFRAIMDEVYEVEDEPEHIEGLA